MAAADTAEGRVIALVVQRFLLYYSGVFALVALTAAVGAGLLAADKIVVSPGRRVAAQAVHRAISLVALAALATHIVFEIIANQARVTDAFVPFLAQRRTFYTGVGTIASDLVVLIIATGIVRRRFAGGRAPWAWRVLHVTAYLAWPFAILHGLLGGRPARPYVHWSYGACLAAVALALVMRLVAQVRGRDTAGQPVPDRASWPAHAAALAGTGPAAALAAQPRLSRPAAPRQPQLALPPAGQAGRPRDRPGYEQDRPRYEQDRPGYEQDRPGYEQDRPGYERDRPGYEQDRPGYEQDRLGYIRDRLPRPRDHPALERDRPACAHDDRAGQYQGAAPVVRVRPVPGDEP
jgi:hypothetical protein